MTPSAVESGKRYQPVNNEVPQDQTTLPCHDDHKAKAFGRECTTDSLKAPSASLSPEELGAVCPRVNLDSELSLFDRCPKAVKIPVNALFHGVMSGVVAGVATLAITGMTNVIGRPFGYGGVDLAASYPVDPLAVGFKVGALTGALCNVIAEIADLPDSYFIQSFRDTCFNHTCRVMFYGSLGAFVLGYPVVAACALGITSGMVSGFDRHHNVI